MVELKRINKDYPIGNQKIRALKDINITFRKKEFVCVVGPSGCGKTTLLNVIGSLDKHTSGAIIINGKQTQNYKNKDWDKYRNQSIGFVFQNYNLIPHLSVYENIEMALILSRLNQKKRKKKIFDVLKKVGLSDQSKKHPNQLSGGQMQRVAIARAIVNDPEIILADEPTGALDSKTATQIVEILKEISKEKLVIMVTHNEGLADKFATRAVKLLDGDLVYDSNPYEYNDHYQEDNTNKKVSMSYGAALKLSFKNLITKKLRTSLIILAGCIGIVGITLVLTVSYSVDAYIEDIQKATLSNYPITIRSVYDLDDPFAEHIDLVEYPDTEEINVINANRPFYSHVNIMANDFISHINEMDSDLYNVIDYNRRVRMNIYTIMHGSYRRIHTTRFTEMSDDVNYVSTQYDVLAGKLPTEKHELAILVDKSNSIDARILHDLGIDYQDISNYTFSEMMEKEYKVVLNNTFYIKHESGLYGLNSNIDEIYNNAEITLKISGIVRVNKKASTALYSSGILYSKQLGEYIVESALASDIVQDQIAYGYSKNVHTGQPFEDEESIYSKFTKEYLYELKLVDLGAKAQIQTVRIYTDTFNSRLAINNYLEQYNQGLEHHEKILFSDFMGRIAIEFDTFVQILTRVLIIFASVSLLVSTIMIGIITYVSVMERIKEIGILRSLGARKVDIANVFNAETTIIGFTSGVFGIVLGIILINPIINMIVEILEKNNVTTFDLTQMNVVHFNPYFIAVIIIGSIVLTIIAGIIPAIIAAHKSPVMAIKRD